MRKAVAECMHAAIIFTIVGHKMLDAMREGHHMTWINHG